MLAIEFFSISIPLWAVLLCALLLVVVIWGFLKFTLRVLMFFFAFFILLIGLDWLGVFSWINQHILAYFL